MTTRSPLADGTSRPGRVVVAPDKFKGSLRADEVAAAVARGIARVVPAAEVVTVPVADGGEGTVDAAVSAGFARHPVTVTGPTGAPVRAAFAVRDRTAVVELALASGLVLLPAGERDARHATSRGTGELVRAALDAGCSEIVLGLGGSASTDGGAGLLLGLGARLLDGGGAEIAPGGAGLLDLETVDLAGLDPRLRAVDLVLASDVDNPLLGPRGAATVYGPQKGADADDVADLERALGRWASLVDASVATQPGAGAAGGVGFAALALGARFRPGVEVVLDLVGFASAVSGARLVITGEGALDEQTAAGKAPAGVASASGAAGIPVVAVCGRSSISARQAADLGIDRVYALADLEPDVDRSMRDAARLVADLGEQIARDLLLTTEQ